MDDMVCASPQVEPIKRKRVKKNVNWFVKKETDN